MLGLLLVLLACAPEPEPGPRAGRPDADGGAQDSGDPLSDGGSGDGGSGDGGSGDGGSGDGGSADGGSDGGSGDGGSGDGGSSDGGSGDGGSGDGGSEAEPCPSGVVCVDSFPYSDSDDTSRSSRSDFDAYACAPSTDESGPEVVYQVDLDEDGYLAATLSGLGSGVDVDVHILGSLDADDCYDRGHWDAGSYLPAGRYYVVVDSWASGSTVYDGAYTLDLGHTAVDAFESDGLDATVADQALHAFDTAWMNGDTESLVYTIIDFSLPSDQEREFIIDLASGELLYSLYVTHGENSADPRDPAMAVSFSNTNNSHQSSLGVMLTGETYTGDYGYSLRLDGLEDDYNDNVRSRAIVIHPWYYARAEVAAAYGYLGLSWGCPAIDDRISEEVIDTIKDGSLVIAWYPDGDWSVRSDYLP